MSTPWGEPGASPLRDIQEFKREAERGWPPPPFQVILPDWWPEDWPGRGPGG